MSAARPKSCGISSSARNEPSGPMKLRAGPPRPALKKTAGSEGSKVARLVSSISASPKESSLRNSESRRDFVIALLDLHHHRDDHRPPLQALLEEAAQLGPHALAQQRRIVPLVQRPRLHRLLEQPGG